MLERYAFILFFGNFFLAHEDKKQKGDLIIVLVDATYAVAKFRPESELLIAWFNFKLSAE